MVKISTGFRLLLGLISLWSINVSSAQTFNEWKDPAVNEVNRLPMHADFLVMHPKLKRTGRTKQDLRTL